VIKKLNPNQSVNQSLFHSVRGVYFYVYTLQPRYNARC